ncbi:hypothetical protein M9H77_06494 [Catharanthus roseus]|uniref:Uncharacterized protein n=1 Tax=Catharanthus roseus TaxID=4058 RepID=A0ACC0BSA2_CATRO|nr:hypothetical protein M9H77_06494 [Catharanthus roseus]
MLCCSTLQVTDKGLLFSAQQSSLSDFHSSAVSRWGFKPGQDPLRISRSTRSRAFQVLVNPNVSSGKRNSGKEVIMVDPLEAKRLAAKQMEKIKAKERFKRRREIEAINGAWAMIGLTAGLVIEGHTGNTILSQLSGYWAAFVGLFLR